MPIKSCELSLQVKADGDNGVIEGYGSVFGTVDSYGERVIPGAFAKSLEKHNKNGTKVKMLNQHFSHQPIGVWDNVIEDEKGLHCRGRLLTTIPKSREIFELLKEGAIDGLSIGYREIETSRSDGDVLDLEELDLKEVSVVTFPANEDALVTDIKAAAALAEFATSVRRGHCPSIKEFEHILRDAGMPKVAATKIAAHGYKQFIQGDPDGDQAIERAERFAQAYLA